MKKNVFLIFLVCFACITFLLVSPSCKSPSHPSDVNPPEPTKLYTLKIWYIRTEISWPNVKETSIDITICRASQNTLNYATGDIECQPQDDYNYFPGKCQLNSNTTDTWYDIWAVDGGRYDGSDDSSRVVGDRFIIRVEETGFETELEDIVPNRTIYSPAHGEKARMARFRITYEGQIISNRT